MSSDRRWTDAIFRAIFNGERRINTLIAIGRGADGPADKTIRAAVVKLLKVPFPRVSQAGPVPCEQHENTLAKESPDLQQEGKRPDLNLTGRYEADGVSGGRYFWAINQAGKAIIAIRTLRDFGKRSRDYWELHGDLQGDGTAVLFQADKPENFWGYLQVQSVGSVRWHYGSYLGPDGSRVFVAPDANADEDEVLRLGNARPTLMASTYKSDDNYLSVLLQQREWWPLTRWVYSFLEERAGSDLLRHLIQDYLRRPSVTFQEQQDKHGAAARIVSYLGHLLWDGDSKTKPDSVPLPPELQRSHGRDQDDFVRQTFKVIPHGHHNNLVLATHTAKIRLAREKLDYGSVNRSFLDWLITVGNERLAAGWRGEDLARKLSKLLDVSFDRAAGTYQYHLKLDAATVGFYVEGTLLVEQLTPPKWKEAYNVYALSRPHLPGRDTVFDLRVETPQQWTADDFAGTLVLAEVDVSAEGEGVKVGVKMQGSYLRSPSGLWMGLEDADTSAGLGKGGKVKLGSGWNAMAGIVRRTHDDFLIDLSTAFPGSTNVVGDLDKAWHFCFDSALLTPAARQLLRVVCADRLAALSSPDTKIMIVGYADQPGSYEYNQTLSERRAANVRTALGDILNGALKVPLRDIQVVGYGKVPAVIADLAKLRFDQEKVRRPEYRKVDLLIDYSIVASFHPQTSAP